MKQLMAAVLAGASVESETADSSLGSSRFEKKKREKRFRLDSNDFGCHLC